MPKARPKPASIEINLLPQDPFFETAVGRTLKWALSAGRYLVIFTELVVIISFATRFSLDRQLTDINGSIHNKVSIIESYGGLEERVRLAQAQLSEYKNAEQQSNIIDVFANLTLVTPRGLTFEKLAINQTSVVVAGTAPTQQIFNLLINNLQLSPDFVNVSVDKVEASKTTPGFDFRLQAELPVKAASTKESNK